MAVRGLDKGERCGLIISECQMAMLDKGLRGPRDTLAVQAEEDGLVPAIAELAEGCRRAGQPVVHSHIVPRSDWSGFALNCTLAGLLKRTNTVAEGRPGTGPVPGLLPQPGDYLVRRPTGMTSFYGTEIDAVLRAEGVKTVIVAGVSINVAVYGTVLEAVNRGYSVVVARDCVVGVGPSQYAVADTLLPLLATITDRASILELLAARPAMGSAAL